MTAKFTKYYKLRSLISSCFCDHELFVIHAFVPVAFSAFYLLKAVCKRCLFAGSFGYFFFPFESLLYQTV